MVKNSTKFVLHQCTNINIGNTKHVPNTFIKICLKKYVRKLAFIHRIIHRVLYRAKQGNSPIFASIYVVPKKNQFVFIPHGPIYVGQLKKICHCMEWYIVCNACLFFFFLKVSPLKYFLLLFKASLRILKKSLYQTEAFSTSC